MRFRRAMAFKAIAACWAPVSPGLGAVGSASARSPGGRVAPDFPWISACTPVSPRNYVSSNSGPAAWQTADWNASVAGFQTWQASLRENGTPVVSMGTGPSVLTVIRGTPRETNYDPNANHDHNGDTWDDHTSQANCTKMQISSPVGASWIPRTAAHEMGHSIGLKHTGFRDTRQVAGGFNAGWWTAANSGERPLMNGCESGDLASPGPDDWSNLTKRVIGNGQLTAEAGFESAAVSSSVWRGPITTETAAPASGSRYVSIAQGSSIEQRSRIFASTETRFRARAAYKSNGSGSANFKVYGKRVTYVSWECGSVSYSDSDWVTIQSISKVDTNGASTWESHYPATDVFPLGNYSTYEIRLEAYNNTGDRLFLDNLKVELL